MHELAQRGGMQGVLAGLLGTYTSRNSDLGGYWLLGQVPIDSWPSVVDLLGEPPGSPAPVDAARRIAIARFRDQLQKAGVQVGHVATATLEVITNSPVVRGWRGDYGADGREVRFVARATMTGGRTYTCECAVFVAPHDPAKERRRLPDTWGT